MGNREFNKRFLTDRLENALGYGLVKITKEMIMTMHEDLIRVGGQIQGVLCEGTVDYFVEEINSVPGVYAKSALALYMSRYHPFFDGNKRTSFVLAATILKLNSHYLGRSDEDEIIDALQKISNSEVDCNVEIIEQWLKKKSKTWFKARQRSIYDYL